MDLRQGREVLKRGRPRLTSSRIGPPTVPRSAKNGGNRPTCVEALYYSPVSVIVEFTVANQEFLLGQVLADAPDMRIELERIVPTGSDVIPFLWVYGEDYDTFEQGVRTHERVAELIALDRLKDEVLYRIKWAEEPHSLLEGINDTGGVILEATIDGSWEFKLRFSTHDAVSQFYNFCTDQGITIHLEQVYTLTERTDVAHNFGLSREEHEALLLALDSGYFATPSEANLADLAAELDISEQATSDRIRRGNEKVLREVLLSSAADL